MLFAVLRLSRTNVVAGPALVFLIMTVCLFLSSNHWDTSVSHRLGIVQHTWGRAGGLWDGRREVGTERRKE